MLIVFIEALDGLKPMRKTCEKIKVDAEYRWFLFILQYNYKAITNPRNN